MKSNQSLIRFALIAAILPNLWVANARSQTISESGKMVLAEIESQLSRARQRVNVFQLKESIEEFSPKGSVDLGGEFEIASSVPIEDTTNYGVFELRISFNKQLAWAKSTRHIVEVNDGAGFFVPSLNQLRFTPTEMIVYAPYAGTEDEKHPAQVELYRKDADKSLYTSLGHLGSRKHLAVYWSVGWVLPLMAWQNEFKDVNLDIWTVKPRDVLDPKGNFGPEFVSDPKNNRLYLSWMYTGASSRLDLRKMDGYWVPTTLVETYEAKKKSVQRYEYQWASGDDGIPVPSGWSMTNTRGGKLELRHEGEVQRFDVNAPVDPSGFDLDVPDGLVGRQEDRFYVANERGEFVVETSRDRLSGKAKEPTSRLIAWIAAIGIIGLLAMVWILRKKFGLHHKPAGVGRSD